MEIENDLIDENDEVFFGRLERITDARVAISPDEALVTIVDDDSESPLLLHICLFMSYCWSSETCCHLLTVCMQTSPLVWRRLRLWWMKM